MVAFATHGGWEFNINIKKYYKQELDYALSEDVLWEFDKSDPVSIEAKYAAYELALCLGRCRVFGISLGDEDGTLPVREALAATEICTILIETFTRSVDTLLNEELKEVFIPIILEKCMEFYFVIQAVGELYDDLLEGSKPDQEDPELREVERAFDALLDANEEFQEYLQTPENMKKLANVCELPLLGNWRRMLSGDYKDLPPWWLEGELEKIYEEEYQ